jgi:hypothetical protein
MKAFMVSQKRPFILQLIWKIANFTTWVLGYLRGGLESLVGHIDVHLFRFFVDLFGWPMMQYKVSPTNNVWSPTKGPPIQLWKANANGSLKLPIKVPNPIPYHPIWGHDVVRLVEREKFINARLSKYVEFWKQCIDQNTTYAMKMNLYVDYWEDVLLHLPKPLPTRRSILLEGFWPSNNWKLNYARVELSFTRPVVDLKDLVNHPYYGPTNLKLTLHDLCCNCNCM